MVGPVTFILFSVGAAAPLGAQPSILTLDEAVALAVENNRRVAVAALEVEKAERRLEATRTQRYPSLDLQTLAGTTLNTIAMTFPAGSFGAPAETRIEAPRAVSAYVTATVAQPLSQLHRIGLGVKMSETSRDIEKEKLRGERAAVVAEVRKLYYAILQTQSVLAATEDQVRVYRELDRVVGQHVTLEVALRSEGLEVKARLAGEEYQLAALRGELASAKERLNHTLGRDPAAEFSVEAVPGTAVEEVDLQAAVAHALEHRADVAQARLAVEQADIDRRMKKAESIPQVSLAVTYTSYVNVDLLPRNVAQAGLQVKWEPFDWGRKGKERAEKALQLQQSRASAREAESAARLEVAQRFRKLQEARMLLAVQRLGLDAAKEKLRITQSRHRVESALLRDVLESQAAVMAARADHDRALLSYWTERADFRNAIGEEL
jgi:outer membrane protein TolC